MSRPTSQAGATLVEALVIMVVAAIVGGGLFSVVTTSARSERSLAEAQDEMDAVRIALDRVRRELRGAQRVGPDPTGRRLEIMIDHDADGTTDEIVVYELVPDGDGATLWRATSQSPGTPQRVASDLLANEPFHYPENNAGRRGDRVVIVIEARASQDREPLRAQAEVRLRNVQI